MCLTLASLEESQSFTGISKLGRIGVRFEVGAHGAGLAWLQFMEGGCVIELMPKVDRKGMHGLCQYPNLWNQNQHSIYGALAKVANIRHICLQRAKEGERTDIGIQIGGLLSLQADFHPPLIATKIQQCVSFLKKKPFHLVFHCVEPRFSSPFPKSEGAEAKGWFEVFLGSSRFCQG